MTNENLDTIFSYLTEGHSCEEHLLSITTAVVCAGFSVAAAVDQELDVVFDDMAGRGIFRSCKRRQLERLLRAVGENWRERLSVNEDINKRSRA